MSAQPYLRYAVRAYGLHGGWVANWDGPWWFAYDRAGNELGHWSTRRRALHAIAQDKLRDLYSGEADDD